jgi:hypothetical protein
MEVQIEQVARRLPIARQWLAKILKAITPPTIINPRFA